MAQLLNITTDSFQFVRFTQNARLVSEQSLDIERRKAMARQQAFAAQHRKGPGAINISDVSQINRAFSGNHNPTAQVSQPAQQFVQSSQSAYALNSFSRNQEVVSTADKISSDAQASDFNQSTYTVPNSNVPSQAQASYDVQRGSFEMRVAKGDISFVPALSMTIVTQYPAVHFEYTGGINYFPKSADPNAGQLNLSV